MHELNTGPSPDLHHFLSGQAERLGPVIFFIMHDI